MIYFLNGLFKEGKEGDKVNDGSVIDYSQTFVSKNWRMYYGNYRYGNVIIGKNMSDSILHLPAVGSGQYLCFGDFRKVKEIYVDQAEPNGEIIFNGDRIKEDIKKDIILHVPYGCLEAYQKDSYYCDFKEIKEMSLGNRIASTIEYYWYGIVYSFNAHALLFYLLIIVGLCILFGCFYWLRKKQLKNMDIHNVKPAIWAGLSGIPVAIVSFIPIYYLIYIYVSNYAMAASFENGNLRILMGTIGGVISSCVCSYMFIFSGNGKIWNFFKRIKNR